jgi:hypothetical protein
MDEINHSEIRSAAIETIEKFIILSTKYFYIYALVQLRKYQNRNVNHLLQIMCLPTCSLMTYALHEVLPILHPCWAGGIL